MGITWLLTIACLAFSLALVRQASREPDRLLCLGMTPLLAVAIALQVGARVPRTNQGVVAAILLLATLLLLPWSPPKSKNQPSLGSLLWLPVALLLALGIGAQTQQNPEFSRGPVAARYAHGLSEATALPPSDLLLGLFTTPGTDPIVTFWVLQLVLGISLLLALQGTLRRFGMSGAGSWAGATLVLLGLFPGPFQGANFGHLLLPGWFYWAFRTLELDQAPSYPPTWVLAGLYTHACLQLHPSSLIPLAGVWLGLCLWKARTARSLAGAVTAVVLVGLLGQGPNVALAAPLSAPWLVHAGAALSAFYLFSRGLTTGIAFWAFGLLAMFGDPWLAAVGFFLSFVTALDHYWNSPQLWSDCEFSRHRLSLVWNRPRALTVGSLLLAFLLALPGLAALARALNHQPVLDADRWRMGTQLSLTPADLEAISWLQERLLPEEKVLTNLDPALDEVLCSRTGATFWKPTAAKSAVPLLFFRTARPELLYPEGIHWLLVDPSTFPAAQKLEQHSAVMAGPVFRDQAGHHRQVYELRFEDWKLWSSQPPFRHRVVNRNVDLEPGKLYPLNLTVANPQPRPARLGWVRSAVERPDGTPMTELLFLVGRNPLPVGAGDIQQLFFSAPEEAGEFMLKLSFLGHPPFHEEKIQVGAFDDFQSLRPDWQIPERLASGRSTPFSLRLVCDETIASDGQLLLQMSFEPENPQGQGLNFEIPLQFGPGRDHHLKLQLVPPVKPGRYLLRGWLKAGTLSWELKRTGVSVLAK